MNFAAWAAGPRLAHLPKILFQARNFEHAILARTDFCPQGSGIMIRREFCAGHFRAAENREIKLFERDAVPLRRSNELPRESNCVRLEIIAKRKITEHLKKSVMTVREADVLKIVVLAARAHTFLASGGAAVIALFEAEENVLKLIHAGIREEQRGIVRGHERAAADDAVPALFEKPQKHFSDFVAGQSVLGKCNLLWQKIGGFCHRATEAQRK